MTIEVVQYEHKGIPYEPFLFVKESDALKKVEELIESQGFRKRTPDESILAYMARYTKILDQEGKDWEDDLELSPKFEPDDTVRWWSIDVDISTGTFDSNDMINFANNINEYWNQGHTTVSALKKYEKDK